MTYSGHQPHLFFLYYLKNRQIFQSGQIFFEVRNTLDTVSSYLGIRYVFGSIMPWAVINCVWDTPISHHCEVFLLLKIIFWLPKVCVEVNHIFGGPKMFCGLHINRFKLGVRNNFVCTDVYLVPPWYVFFNLKNGFDPIKNIMG